MLTREKESKSKEKSNKNLKGDKRDFNENGNEKWRTKNEG
jgi:hypothetical protein